MPLSPSVQENMAITRKEKQNSDCTCRHAVGDQTLQCSRGIFFTSTNADLEIRKNHNHEIVFQWSPLGEMMSQPARCFLTKPYPVLIHRLAAMIINSSLEPLPLLPIAL